MGLPAKFFDTVRPLFGGKLSQGQVEGMTFIVEYGQKWEYSQESLGYILATVWHETSKWMQPIREGARRYGKDYTNEQAIRAVTSIFHKGIIKKNYALPVGKYMQNYYGRGLVQITWEENYGKFENLLGVPLLQNPDLALEWPIALDILFLGMRDGMFRSGYSVDMINSVGDYYEARNIVNGDKKKYGKTVADAGEVFFAALDGMSGVNRKGDNAC